MSNPSSNSKSIPPTNPDLDPNSNPPPSPEKRHNTTNHQLPVSNENKKGAASSKLDNQAQPKPPSPQAPLPKTDDKSEASAVAVRGTPSQQGGRAAGVNRGAIRARIAAMTPEQKRAYCLEKYGQEIHPMAEGVNWDGREDILYESGYWDTDSDDVEGGGTLEGNSAKKRMGDGLR